VNVEEVWRGARPEEEDAVHDLLGALATVSLTEREGEVAGRWRREHASRGVTLGQGDALVAAAAVGAGATLVTGNPKDFPMPEVEVEHWPAGV